MKEEKFPRCLWCGCEQDDGDILSLFRRPDPLCASCRGLLEKQPVDIVLDGLKIHSLYRYEKAGREMLLQYKELLDEALYPVFFYTEAAALRKKYRGYTVVPLPPSAAGYARRGFSHVVQIFSLLELPVADILEKPPLPEQKTLSRSRRYLASRRIRLKEGAVIPPGKILLADDLVTTGASLTSAKECLVSSCREVRALTVFAHPKYYEKNRSVDIMNKFK